MLVKASRVKGCAVPIWLDPPPGTGVMCVVIASARFVRHPVGYGGAVAHLLAVDLDDPADRTDRKTEPHQPLRRTWIIGWHEARQLVLAYISMTAVFALVGWVAFGHHRRWWLVNVDERISRWFADQRTDPLNTATLIGSWLSETVTKIAVTAIVVLILLRWLHRWYEALVVAVALILEAMVFITSTFIVGRERPPVPHLDGSPVGSSFPSGHVAAAVCYAAIAIVAGRNCARRWVVVTLWTIAVATPIIVGLSRMYRGMHFMSDVVAGMILGVVSVVVTLLILTPAERERRAGALPPAQRSTDTDLDSAPANPVSASPVPGGIS
jgi:undecaprenyl-diphosphatase